MSYILDALRRAERERNFGQAPDLQHISSGDGARQIAAQRPVWPWLALGFLLACGLVGLLLLLPKLEKSAAPASLAAAVPAPVSVPAPTIETSVIPAAEVLNITSLDDLVDNSATATPAKPAPAEDKLQSFDAQTKAAPGQTAASTEQAPSPVDEEEASPAQQVERFKLDPAPPPEVQKLKDMPADYRADFPKLALDVHVYDEDPARRFVMINARRYREGDRLNEGPQIAEITPDGVIFSYRGQEVLLPLAR